MKTNILVVDDEVDLEFLIKHKFRRKIREGTYAFHYAHNGEEALAYLHDHADIDIVLSDIRMPVMDGLTLLTKLPAINPVLKAVMVSAYGDMENIRTAMNRGAFDFVCKPVDFNDLELTISKTAEHVEQLRQTLRTLQENNILKMYVDETVLNSMTRSGFQNILVASEIITATVVFIDICGFTSLAEVLPPTAVVTLLNTYFDQATKEIIMQGGYIDKFIGDAIMAVFRGDFHLDRAIDAALAVRTVVQANQTTLPDGKAYQPELSIGINAGEMVAGNIGSASLKRFGHTVIGDAVNVSQRLQTVADPGQILITEATYELVKESFQCQPTKKFSLKDRAAPIMVYEVIA